MVLKIPNLKTSKKKKNDGGIRQGLNHEKKKNVKWKELRGEEA
jgi:hypothetical protein